MSRYVSMNRCLELNIETFLTNIWQANRITAIRAYKAINVKYGDWCYSSEELLEHDCKTHK